MKRASRRLGLVLLTSSLLAFSLLATATQGTPTAKAVCVTDCWAVIPSPNISSVTDNILYSVAAVGLNDVWSVGTYVATFGENGLLAEHWDGTAWTINRPPNPSIEYNVLYGVTAPKTDSVWAVGTYEDDLGTRRTLVEKWNGSTWNQSTSENQGTGHNELHGVDIDPTNGIVGWAVGHYINASGVAQTLIERTTDSGATWRIFPSPNADTGLNNYLLSVTQIPSSPGDMMAVGYFISAGVHQPLTMLYRGGTWTLKSAELAPGSGSNDYKGVAAIDPNRVWAVGDYVNASGVRQTLAGQWNNIKWTFSLPLNTSTSENNHLQAVSLLGTTNPIWAVGYATSSLNVDSTVAQYYLGTWRMTTPVNPSLIENRFYGTEHILGAAGSAGVATTWAVGEYRGPSGYFQQTLIERYVESASSHP